MSPKKQLHSGLSQKESSLSSPSAKRLRAWRLFFESGLALNDVLGSELERDAGIPLRWYDVLGQLEEAPDGIPMTALADRILFSKSGFTRVIDRMEEAPEVTPRPAPAAGSLLRRGGSPRFLAGRGGGALVARVRPQTARRTTLVVPPSNGIETRKPARRYHRDGIDRHFSQHLPDDD